MEINSRHNLKRNFSSVSSLKSHGQKRARELSLAKAIRKRKRLANKTPTKLLSMLFQQTSSWAFLMERCKQCRWFHVEINDSFAYCRCWSATWVAVRFLCHYPRPGAAFVTVNHREKVSTASEGKIYVLSPIGKLCAFVSLSVSGSPDAIQVFFAAKNFPQKAQTMNFLDIINCFCGFALKLNILWLQFYGSPRFSSIECKSILDAIIKSGTTRRMVHKRFN